MKLHRCCWTAADYGNVLLWFGGDNPVDQLHDPQESTRLTQSICLCSELISKWGIQHQVEVVIVVVVELSTLSRVVVEDAARRRNVSEAIVMNQRMSGGNCLSVC